MSDEPENLVLRYLRRIDERVERLTHDVQELKFRLSAVEQQIAQLAASQASQYAVLSNRMDRIETRLDRIERRLDLVEHRV